jgi:hypothetical protein
MQMNNLNMPILVFILLIIILPFSSVAQKYNIAGGLRWGGDLGLSISERIAKRITLEQNFNSADNNHYYSLFALARYHQPLVTKRFNWFYGGGVGIVGVKETGSTPESNSLSLILQTGLEYTIKRATFYIALEPYAYINNRSPRFYVHKVFSLKYVIFKRKSKFKKSFLDRFKRKKKRGNSSNSWWKFWKKSK